MEDLSKSQIVLLCILISFIVSIATGIMTTSLLMEAPIELTQTVNRVVERTIETVTPAGTVASLKPTPTQIQTVVISEDESVTKTVSKNTPAVVRIYGASADGTINNLYSLGVVLTADGIIVADKEYISPVMTYTATMSDGSKVPLAPVTLQNSPASQNSAVVFFKAKPATPHTFAFATLSGNDIQLGQTIVVMGGVSSNAVSVGRVVSLSTKDVTQPVGATSTTTTPTKYVSSIETDTSPKDLVFGAPILSLSGDVVGMSLSEFSSRSYYPSALIKKEFAKLQIAQ